MSEVVSEVMFESEPMSEILLSMKPSNITSFPLEYCYTIVKDLILFHDSFKRAKFPLGKFELIKSPNINYSVFPLYPKDVFDMHKHWNQL